MNKRILGAFVCMMLITAVLPAVGSMNKIDSNKLHTEIIADDGCGCDTNNEINVKNGEYVYLGYPVMEDQIVQLDSYDVSPKPQIMNTPAEFSWLDHDGQDWTTSVKRQLCGDCWDFAAIGVLESIVNIREGCAELNPDLSEQYVLSCLPGAGSCHGGSSSRAMRFLMETTPEGNYHNGAIPESCFPYQGDDDVPCSDKCPNWVDLLVPILDYGSWRSDGSPSDMEAIKTQIMLTGPVAAGIKATDFFSWWGSIQHNPDKYFPYLKQALGINHVVVIAGWKDSPLIHKGGYWICKNSWGTDWGYEGFFNIEYNALNIDKSTIVWADYDPESVDWPPIADAGGLYFGDIDEEITFNADQSYDPDGEIVTYHWDFGDGTNDTGITAIHSYSQQGIYPVMLVVTDSGGNTANDATWAGIEEDISPPNAPTINGPVRPTEGIEYEYTFIAVDPEGDNVYYYIDWGGYFDIGEWIGPYSSGEQIILTHTWNKGTYTIKAKAKDIYDQESEWGYLEVKTPINQPSIYQQNSQSSQQNSYRQFATSSFFQMLQRLMNIG